MPHYATADELRARDLQFVRRIHHMRMLGTALCALPIASVLAERGAGWPAYALLAANALLWPQFANVASVRARDPVTAQIQMRFTLDLRRLKEIKSVQAKIEAKREMLPDYAAWVEGWFSALEQTGEARKDEIVSTMMVWKIDTGDYAGALELAEPLISHGVPLPARYARDTATLVVEEIAEAALKALSKGEDFPLNILQQIEALTVKSDIHDEVNAKLFKAIGLEFLRQANLETDLVAQSVFQFNAYRALVKARDLDDRIGVKKEIEKLARTLKNSVWAAPNGDIGGGVDAGASTSPASEPPSDAASTGDSPIPGSGEAADCQSATDTTAPDTGTAG